MFCLCLEDCAAGITFAEEVGMLDQGFHFCIEKSITVPIQIELAMKFLTYRRNIGCPIEEFFTLNKI